MKFKKMLAIFLSAALFVTAFAGCGKKKADGITVQIGPNPETLDPALNSAVDGGNMLITLFVMGGGMLITGWHPGKPTRYVRMALRLAPTVLPGPSLCVTALNGQTVPSLTLRTLSTPLSV